MSVNRMFVVSMAALIVGPHVLRPMNDIIGGVLAACILAFVAATVVRAFIKAAKKVGAATAANVAARREAYARHALAEAELVVINEHIRIARG